MGNKVTQRYAAMHRKISNNLAGTGLPGMKLKNKKEREAAVARHNKAADAWDAAKNGQDANAIALSSEAGILI